MLYKGDEMWLGFIRKSAYNPTSSVRCHAHGIFYYGGRESDMKSHGPNINDLCIMDEYKEDDNDIVGLYGGQYYSDCNHGSIQGNRKVIKHPLDSYTTGDWINFKIDLGNKTVVFYKNGIEQYSMNG